MNAGLDKQLLQEFYERMTDDEILRIVTNDVAGLTPEAREVTTMEVKKRRLDVDTAAITDADSDTESPTRNITGGLKWAICHIFFKE